MKIGITGATGQLGRLVVEGLKGKVAPADLVALVRSPESATDLGLEARPFNYDKADLLTDALRGIDTLLLISGSEVGARTQQHGNVIRAAKSAGVTWIVYTSLLHADHSSLSLATEHVETEALLKASGISYTILRNGWYTENYTGSIANAIAGGAFVGSAGDGQIASAARADYAAAAVAVLTSAGHQGKTYELAGDTAYTLTDLAAEVSKQTGKNIPYMNLPEAEYANLLISFEVPAPLAQAIAGWDSGAGRGDLFDDSKTLSKLIGRPTTPLADVVQAAL